MEGQDIYYSPKYHPDTSRLLKQAIQAVSSLLVITLLTLGTAILGT